MDEKLKLPLMIILWSVVVVIVVAVALFLYGAILAFGSGPEIVAGAI